MKVNLTETVKVDTLNAPGGDTFLPAGAEGDIHEMDGHYVYIRFERPIECDGLIGIFPPTALKGLLEVSPG